ncbi:hypothetical protein ACP70R_006185 [Stipagrostis hirtigluma subsp. patula]
MASCGGARPWRAAAAHDRGEQRRRPVRGYGGGGARPWRAAVVSSATGSYSPNATMEAATRARRGRGGLVRGNTSAAAQMIMPSTWSYLLVEEIHLAVTIRRRYLRPSPRSMFCWVLSRFPVTVPRLEALGVCGVVTLNES